MVTYIDSHACELAQGGYEVFLLMEFCSGTLTSAKDHSYNRRGFNRLYEYTATGSLN